MRALCSAVLVCETWGKDFWSTPSVILRVPPPSLYVKPNPTEERIGDPYDGGLGGLRKARLNLLQFLASFSHA